MKVGDYVRTKSYGITKILNIYNNTTTNYGSITLDIIDCFGRLGVIVGNNDIIKSSPNIIDLIEVGDYVNGLKVANIENNNITMFGLLMKLGQADIKSIVTKEQFESMEYKV